MQDYNYVDQKRKKRLMLSRIFGIAISIAIIVILLCFYFRLIDEWVLCLCVIMLSAINFTINAAIVETKETSNKTKANFIVSAFFFAVGVGFLIYGIASGNLVFIV